MRKRPIGSSESRGVGREATRSQANVLGARAKKVLEFIVTSILEKGLPPTIREIGKEFKISSTNGVRYYLGVLERAGCIKRKGKISRGIEVQREWFESAAGESRDFVPDYVRGAEAGVVMESGHRGPLELVEVPVVGRVAAGIPVLAEENIEDVIAVDRRMVKSGKLFALKVRGDSMKEAGLLDGDIAIVKQQSHADSGDIVVALLDDEATVKRYVLKENETFLKPENENYESISIKRGDRFSIVGKVIGSIRRFG